PTLYTVDRFTDHNPPPATGEGSGTTGDLRYVIGKANADPNPDGSLIRFDATVFATPQTINLQATLELSETGGLEEIRGTAAGLATVSAEAHVRVFQVDGGVTAAIGGLTIADGLTSGSFGGAGILNHGSLTVANSRISNNFFIGGVGGGIFNDGTL